MIVPDPHRQPRASRLRALIAVVLLGLIQPAFVWSCPFALPETTVMVKDRRLTVEVAGDPKARECGLSRRNHLPRDRGMLFVYEKPMRLTYWMKDTFVPLSIAFLDADGRIINIQQMAPNQTTERYQSHKPARYALEANRGWFEANRINVGDTVSFDLSGVPGKQ